MSRTSVVLNEKRAAVDKSRKEDTSARRILYDPTPRRESGLRQLTSRQEEQVTMFQGTLRSMLPTKEGKNSNQTLDIPRGLKNDFRTVVHGPSVSEAHYVGVCSQS